VVNHEEQSIIELVDSLVHTAIERSASDIHIESTQHGARVRYRIDGVLYDQETISVERASQVISRLKVLAHVNIAEKRVPQDGKFQVALTQERDENALSFVDLRVSTFPALHGEKIVVRILDRNKNMIKLDALGFTPEMQKNFEQLITRPSGFFLVTGPTGSGKTTTLYAALAQLNTSEKNIITLEDPVEYNLEGITQGQINQGAGFTFEKGIRAVLRQDPDIAMVGEIRDRESAQIAIEAALTGHAVFSTLHTNDAPGAIMRLMDMGIEPFLINAAVTGVLAQRLARKICDHCRVFVRPTAQEREALKRWGSSIDQLSIGKGCDHCFGLGYRGRVGIFELLVMTSDLRSLIVRHPIFDDIHRQIRADGMMTLLDDGLRKVQDGIISVHELGRVVL
jgi:type II secretory ATPase GspE/PulE/Tfp pilus assembly ATPase PilB-like protein